MRRQCELLGVSRSSVYYQSKGESLQNLQLMRLLDERHLQYPAHGVLQMQDFLCLQGCQANHKRVRRLLRKMDIMVIYPKDNLSKPGRARYVKPCLLKGLNVCRAHQVWAIDITCIPMASGFMYLTAIIDLYSCFVVGRALHKSLEAENSRQVLKMAISRYGKPEMSNSDQGSQFTSELWVEYLAGENIKVSMDGKGRATDNIFIERLWRTVKQDYVYFHPANDGLELYKGLKGFFHFYNHEKTRQGIGRQRPVDLYQKAA